MHSSFWPLRIVGCLLIDILFVVAFAVPASIVATYASLALGISPVSITGNLHGLEGLVIVAPIAIWVTAAMLYASQPLTLGMRATHLVLTRNGEHPNAQQRRAWAYLLLLGLLFPPVLLVAVFIFRLEPIGDDWRPAERAPTLRRILAFAVDALLIATCVHGLVAGVRDFCLARHFSDALLTRLCLQAFGIAMLMIGPLYGTLLEWATGATVGHRLLGIRPLPVGTGDKVPFLWTLIRNIGKPLGLTLLVEDFCGVGLARAEAAKTAKAAETCV